MVNLKTRVIASRTGLHIHYQEDFDIVLEMTIEKCKVPYLGVARCNKFIISTNIITCITPNSVHFHLTSHLISKVNTSAS